jgi:HSP20 family protein
MTTEIATKTKAKEQPAVPARAVSSWSEFPFFLSRMRDEFDQLLEKFSRDWPSLWEGRNWRWGLEIEDEDDAIVVKAEAPGFEPGDFDLQVSDNRLVLRATRKVETKGEKGKPSEYQEQECYQSVTLPTGIDKEKVAAKYHNGILSITLPKTAEGKAKRIAVEGG